MGWYKSKPVYICNGTLHLRAESPKQCCFLPGKTLPPCTPVIVAAIAKGKCTTGYVFVSLILLIFLLTAIYWLSAPHIPQFDRRQRPRSFTRRPLGQNHVEPPQLPPIQIEPVPKVEPEPKSQSEPESEPKPELEPESELEPKPEPEPEHEPEPEPKEL